MSKYDALWQHVKADGRQSFALTFGQIKQCAGLEIDHAFLNFKKELLAYGYEVGKISLKNKTVMFNKLG